MNASRHNDDSLAPRPVQGVAWLRLLLAVGLFSACGASCPRSPPFAMPFARALPPAATREQVLAVVNANSARVHSYNAPNASIGITSVPLMPSLKSTIALERPRRFRLRSQLSVLTGPELDVGSNDELFWFWTKRNPSRELYFCRHEEYATSLAPQIMPVEPEWLFEALGLTTLVPEEIVQGPTPVGENRLELRSLRQTGFGPLHRITLIDSATGWVVGEQLYDESSRLLASATMSEHRRDEANNVTLPRRIEIQWPPTQMSLAIDIHELEINAPGDERQWDQPQFDGWANVDLADPNLRLQGPPRLEYEPEAAGPRPVIVRKAPEGLWNRFWQR